MTPIPVEERMPSAADGERVLWLRQLRNGMVFAYVGRIDCPYVLVPCNRLERARTSRMTGDWYASEEHAATHWLPISAIRPKTSEDV